MPDRNQDYEEMTVDELQQIAREQGLTGHSSMRKQELIEALQSGEKQGKDQGGTESRSRGSGERTRKAS